ncbi:MAG TPA: ATP-binding protein, partial [Bacteroidales bacterium]|nr:ATP-binding protein [Bacteroidales bacterium]
MTEILNMSTKRLLRTITQYMDISLLESGNMPVITANISFSELMQPVIAEFEMQCKKKGLSFSFDNQVGNLELITDKSLVEKVITHILDNAVKFTSHGSIQLAARVSGSQIKFEIRDTGKGMEKAFQKRLFDLFVQEDASDKRKFDGSGLGLPIVKGILKLLGGTITVESEPGKGTNFFISLPITVEEPSPATLPKHILPASGPPHILIAEDEDSNFLVLKLLIGRKLKAEVFRAFNGEQAIEMVQKDNQIVLVLMDIKMPVMDGYAASSIIKTLKPSLPIIAITAYGLSGDEQKALQSGCDDYIAKPVQAGVMFQKINKLTGL